MKRIAIFCDGTWNRPDAPYPTNVVRLAQAVRQTAIDGVKQVVVYLPGVGTGRGSNGLARWTDRLLGGALGWGLTDTIVEAYRTLVFAYEPGDQISIFGFSRGAYTARSLAGFIRSCGIAPRAHVARIPEALRRYQKRDGTTHPEDPSSYQFRADFAPSTATSSKELNWRLARGDESILLEIAYLGIWDTVGALGVPGHFMVAPLLNRGNQFHDADLSRSVKSARHAVSIDERRRTFAPTLWANLDQLNGAMMGDLPYLQKWFPGDHGSVGGGGDRVGLSSITLEWIAAGAQAAGLDLSWAVLANLAAGKNHAEALNNKTAPPGLIGGLMAQSQRDRTGPIDLGDLSDAAVARWFDDADYRPATLDGVYAALFRLSREERGAMRDTAVSPITRPVP